MQEKALNAFTQYRVGERALSRTAEAQPDDEWKNELATFGGQVRLVALNSGPSPPSSAAAGVPLAEKPALPRETENPLNADAAAADISAINVEYSYDKSWYSQMQTPSTAPHVMHPSIPAATIYSTQSQMHTAQHHYDSSNTMPTMPTMPAISAPNIRAKPITNSWSYADRGVDTAWSSLMVYTGVASL